MTKKYPCKEQNYKTKAVVLILLSIIVYLIINLLEYTPNISSWVNVFPSVIFTTILIFLPIMGIMSLFLWQGCRVNKIHLPFLINIGVAIPATVLATGVRLLIFNTFFHAGVEFVSLSSVLIPVIIAEAIHLCSTVLLLRWYSKINLKEGLKISIISTIIPGIILILILILLSPLAGLASGSI